MKNRKQKDGPRKSPPPQPREPQRPPKPEISLTKRIVYSPCDGDTLQFVSERFFPNTDLAEIVFRTQDSNWGEPQTHVLQATQTISNPQLERETAKYTKNMKKYESDMKAYKEAYQVYRRDLAEWHRSEAERLSRRGKAANGK